MVVRGNDSTNSEVTSVETSGRIKISKLNLLREKICCTDSLPTNTSYMSVLTRDYMQYYKLMNQLMLKKKKVIWPVSSTNKACNKQIFGGQVFNIYI